MKKLITITLALLLSIMSPIAAFAAGETADAVTVTFTMAANGGFETDKNSVLVIDREVSVTDADGDGAFTLNDAFMCAHNDLHTDGADGYASYEGQYGVSVGKLWGDESGAFGYYINNVSAMSAVDPIADGDDIKAYVYEDQTNWSDMYTWFEAEKTTVKAGEELSVTLLGYTFDANWTAVETPCTTAEITVGQEMKSFAETYTPDENGVVTVKFVEPGEYFIWATSAEGSFIVPSALSVTVEEAEGSTTEDSSSEAEDTADDTADTSESTEDVPEEDAPSLPIYVIVIIGAAIVCGAAVIIKKKAGK